MTKPCDVTLRDEAPLLQSRIEAAFGQINHSKGVRFPNRATLIGGEHTIIGEGSLGAIIAGTEQRRITIMDAHGNWFPATTVGASRHMAITNLFGALSGASSIKVEGAGKRDGFYSYNAQTRSFER
jgi:hypothetical protein